MDILDHIGDKIWWWEPMNTTYKRQCRWRTFVKALFFPVNLYDFVVMIPGNIKTHYGCSKARLRSHDYQWSFGPDAIIRADGLVLDQGRGWWMYCVKCGKGVGDV